MYLNAVVSSKLLRIPLKGNEGSKIGSFIRETSP